MCIHALNNASLSTSLGIVPCTEKCLYTVNTFSLNSNSGKKERRAVRSVHHRCISPAAPTNIRFSLPHPSGMVGISQRGLQLVSILSRLKVLCVTQRVTYRALHVGSGRVIFNFNSFKEFAGFGSLARY